MFTAPTNEDQKEKADAKIRRLFFVSGLWLLRLFLVSLIFLVLANFWVWIWSQPYIYQAEDKLPASDIVMILGASVYSDKNLTPVLRDRAVTALDLYRRGKVKKFLVTGDHTDRYYDEVGPVKEFLLKNGVPERDIHLDDSGIDTYNSMYRAKHIFEVRSMVVVTQNFHLSRAVYLARAVGIEAYGLPADRRPYLVKNSIREFFANVKAVFEVTWRAQPKFLGEKQTISI